jgi:nicotinate-nucleotide adenylyltransferase
MTFGKFHSMRSRSSRSLVRLPGLAHRRGVRIGLLGGSFNPAHEGHLHITRKLRARLRLDHVWWLVSPQNPLKSSRDMAPLAKRIEKAREIAGADRRIVVTDIETRLGTCYTADTIEELVRLAPGAHFVWLMGADNLIQISKWKCWRRIFKNVPVAVYDRPGYTLRAASSKAARTFSHYRLPETQALRLAFSQLPAWIYLHGALSQSSATAIRTRSRLKKTVKKII